MAISPEKGHLVLVLSLALRREGLAVHRLDENLAHGTIFSLPVL
jgi:hypothetical protein